MFDIQSLMTTQYDASNSTSYIDIPEGSYEAKITDLNLREVDTKDGKRVVLDVTWTILDDLSEVTGRESNTVRQSIFLDLTPTGHLDFSEGANVRLGRLRDAVGQNQDGRPWSLADLRGERARIVVSHTLKDDRIYVNVKSVYPLD